MKYIQNKIRKYISYYKSPIGYLKIIADDDYLLGLDFCNKKLEENKNKITEQVEKELEEYFKGERKIFTVKYKLEGTEFQKKVWKELLKIKFGETLSYIDIAEKIGNKKASRAVGGANNKNSIAIIVPCHRVIGKNKKLVGYAGGLDKKEWLLKHENSL